MDFKKIENCFSNRWLFLIVLFAGFIIPQIILFGPSLSGEKILLPLDILVNRNILIPPSNNIPVYPQNFTLYDQVYSPFQIYAAQEFRAGRIPLWISSIFGGVPFVIFGKYSPFWIIYYFFPSPVTLAWIQLVKSIVAGTGAYLFFRLVMKTNIIPAVIGAWCYPLTYFFMQWQGYAQSHVVAWFPWMLLSIDLCIRRPLGWGGPMTALFSCLAILAGPLDIAGLALIGCGLYGVWCLIDEYGLRLFTFKGISAVLTISLAWGVGLLLASPHIFPLLEYSKTGDRMERRIAGEEERPPAGVLEALPQIVFPNIYGSTQKDSLRIVKGNKLESSASAYAGFIVTMFLMPLAWSYRRYFSFNICWIVLSLISLSWVLNIPFIVWLMRLPGLNMFSYNRFVFMASFGILSMAVIGMEVIIYNDKIYRKWFILPMTGTFLIGIWCLYRSIYLPESIAIQFERNYIYNPAIAGLPLSEAFTILRNYYTFFYRVSASLCIFALIGWIIIFFNIRFNLWMFSVLSIVLLTDLLIYAYNINPQTDPSLYFPKIPALTELANHHEPGRIVAVHCLPANLNITQGLSDIRGYDAVDPKRLMDLLKIVRVEGSKSPIQAQVQWFNPKIYVGNSILFLSPILNMLNVRYVIFCGQEVPKIPALIQKDNYTIIENKGAMPRVYIPRKVEFIQDEKKIISRLASLEFNPSEIAFIEEPIDSPKESIGIAKIIEETPSEIKISYNMQTQGLIVLADLWDKGWKAEISGKPAPVLRTNYAIRSVIVPAGQGTLNFRYKPFSFYLGILLMMFAVAIIIIWSILIKYYFPKKEMKFLTTKPKII